jgi:AcrR family transcriptional regulator
MASQRRSTRQRLVQAALELFAEQGVTETSTRQIAEAAEVNEVTLFRQFGSKHGLLLAVMEEAEIFIQLGEILGQQASQMQDFEQALQTYADGHLKAVERIPEFVRSLVGEAGQYPPENRQAIGRGLNQIQRYTAQYLATVIAKVSVTTNLPVERLASLLNTVLLGYAVMEFTTEFHDLWPNREAFLRDLGRLFQPGDAAADLPLALGSKPSESVLDLPAPLVRACLQAAKKVGAQEYALVYVLFGAGLSPGELSGLQRLHSIADAQQHILQIMTPAYRQVPLNQWIMGHRYGSYSNNPLTQWLKLRKDDTAAVFINEATQPLSEVEIRLRWQAITANILTPWGHPPTIEQAQQTWRVEMLMRGMEPESLRLLAGCDLDRLQPYINRAHERLALEKALQLDQRSSSKTATA